jgi:subtilase family serine protease
LGVIRPGDSPAEDEEIVTRQIVIRRINPNLKGVSITGAPSSVLAGTSFNATVTGKNWGPGPAEAGWVGRMYLSTDATFNRTQDALLTGATATFPALGVNSQASRSGSFQVAAGQAGGNYTLFVEVDGNFNVIEEPPGGENDNGLIGIPISITVPQPNIRPYDVASSIKYIAIGTSANVTLTTENAGTAAASGGWWNRLYLSTDNTCCTSDVLLDSTNQTTTIAAGNVGYTSKSVTIPAGTTPGTYYLGAFVDSRATLTESNENDNKGVGLTTIHALQCAWPEEITVLVGQTVTITPTGTCTGRWGVITPANGTLGFGTAAPCSSTSALVKPVGLKFYRCSAGTNTLTVYTDFTLSVVEQVITVSDAF